MPDSLCPTCRVDLDATPTEVSCWRCGWTVRAITHPQHHADLYLAVTGSDPS